MSNPHQSWALPAQGKAAGGRMQPAPHYANTMPPAASAPVAPAAGSIASLYHVPQPDAYVAPAASGGGIVARVSALAGFSSAAKRAQQAAQAAAAAAAQQAAQAQAQQQAGSSGAGVTPMAIPPTVVYPASSLVTGGATAGGGGSAAHSLASTPNTNSSSILGPFRPMGGSGPTTVPKDPSTRFGGMNPVAITSPAFSAGGSSATTMPSSVGGSGSMLSGSLTTPSHWGSSSMGSGSFAGTPSLLASTSTSLQQHAALFGGSTAGGTGGSAGLAPPPGGQSTYAGSAAATSAVSAAASGLGSPLGIAPAFVAVGGVGHALHMQAAAARAEQAQQQKIALDVGQPLHALTHSPDRTLLAVGGKEVKIISYASDKPFHVEHSTNSKTATALSDVQWHPLEGFAHYLAVAPTSGKVLLYHLSSRDGLKRAERTLDDHDRTVNRVVWHPSQGEILFSGSQDGCVKMFDLRSPGGKSVATFPETHSVRDVQVNPFNHSCFAAAYESGAIQIWDVRKGSYFHSINAHQGLILTLDWHPEDKDILASGGIDRAIKVWHIGAGTANTLGINISGSGASSSAQAAAVASGANAASISPSPAPSATTATHQTEALHSIQTIASVGRVKWRPSPKFPFQLASAANIVEHKIHIWNVHRPFVPLVSLLGHRDVITGFFFSDAAPSSSSSSHSSVTTPNSTVESTLLASELISCSKDSTIQKNFLFIDHTLHPSYKLTSYPAESLCTSGISWNVRGQIAIVSDSIERRNKIMEPDAVLPGPGPFNFAAHAPASLSSATVGGTSSSVRGAAAANLQSAVLASMLASRGGAPLTAGIGSTIASGAGMGATAGDVWRNGFMRIFDVPQPQQQNLLTASEGDAPMLMLSEEDRFVHFAKHYRFTARKEFSAAANTGFEVLPNALVPVGAGAAPVNFVTLCHHNSSVARSAGQLELAQVWLVLAQLLGPGARIADVVSDGPPPLPMDEPLAPKKVDPAAAATAAISAAAAAARSHSITYVAPQFSNPATLAHRRAAALEHGGAPAAVPAGVDALQSQFLQVELVSSFDSSTSAAGQVDQRNSGLGFLSPSAVRDSSSSMSPNIVSPVPHLSPNAQRVTRIRLGPDQAASTAPVRSDVHDPARIISALNRSQILLDCLPTIHVSHCVSRPRHSPLHAALAAVGHIAAASSLSAQVAPLPSPSPSAASVALSSAPHPVLSSLRFQSSLLVSYLESLLERGDVQSCVCMASLLREWHAPVLSAMESLEKERETAALVAHHLATQQQAQQHGTPSSGGVNVSSTSSSRPNNPAQPSSIPLPPGHSLVSRLKQLWWSYIELLQRRSLHSSAAELIQLSGVPGPGSEPELAKINQKSTTVTLLCPYCKHQSTQTGVVCTSKNCTKNRMTNCAICHLTVQGVFVWCQGCGHGGHISHMQEWFDQHAVCPTGCMHRCVEQGGIQLHSTRG